MENLSTCKLCGSTNHEHILDAEDHYSKRIFSLVRCSNCELVFTNPRPTENEISEYYPPAYHGESGKRFHFIIEKMVHYFRKRIAEKIDSYFQVSGRILEVGTGRGTLLSEMAKKGWISIGTENSKKLVKEVTDTLGVRVFLAPNLQDCKFPDNYFDVVICYHVLEHLPDPFTTLKEIHRIIHPGGLLITTVPNFDGFTARFSKSHWFGIDVPRHLFHFTPKTLENALSRIGFQIQSRSTFSLEQDVFGFTQSFLNLLGFPFNIFYDFIRSSSGRIRHNFLGITGIQRSIQFILLFFIGGILSVIGLFVAIATSIIGLGGTIEYWSYPNS